MPDTLTGSYEVRDGALTCTVTLSVGDDGRLRGALRLGSANLPLRGTVRANGDEARATVFDEDGLSPLAQARIRLDRGHLVVDLELPDGGGNAPASSLAASAFLRRV